MQHRLLLLLMRLVTLGRVCLVAVPVVTAVLAFVVSGLWLVTPATPPPRPLRLVVSAPSPTPPLPEPWPLSLADDAARKVEGRLRSGDTLARVIAAGGVDLQTVDDIVDAASRQLDPRRLRAGRPYKLYFDADDQLLLFRYLPDRQTSLAVAPRYGAWEAHLVRIPYRLRPGYLHAEVHGSLEGSLARTRAGTQGAVAVTQRLVEIFAWDVDFAADLQPGDKVDLVVEERYLEDEFVGFGDVLAAELEVGSRLLQAVRFRRGDGSLAYFTPEGEALRRSFLRSPVPFTRISSRFTQRRYHPILKVNRPHYGVDYVAPPGTPVQATADGVVVTVASHAQLGRHVKVRHGGSYTSWYLHLSRFADGLRRGSAVQQGEVIGYVGKTGLATSYHLDYRLSRNGQFVDPLREEFPAAEPVPPDDRALFAQQRDRWLSLLRDGQNRSTLMMVGGGS